MLDRQGNDAFKLGEYSRAEELYGKALGVGICDASVLAVLHCNRAAARSHRSDWAGSEYDARECVKLDGKHVKGYYRLAKALEYQNRRGEAVSAAKEGLKLDPCNTELQKLAYPTTGQKEQSSQVGFPQSDSAESSAIRYELDSIKDTLCSRPHFVSGWSTELTDPSTFRARVFPGASFDGPDSPPSTLQDLFGNEKNACVLQDVLSQAKDKAKSVMDSVIAKGVARGESMDKETMAVLWPQALAEAFVRALPGAMSQARKIALVKELEDEAHCLGPHLEEATFEQIRSEAVVTLFERGMVCVPDFLREEDWVYLIEQDLERLDEERAMERKGGVTWIQDPCLIETLFPALNELLTRIKSLPHELSRRIPGLNEAKVPYCGPFILQKLDKTQSTTHRPSFQTALDEAGMRYGVSAVYIVGQFDTSFDAKLTWRDTGGEILIPHEPGMLVLCRHSLLSYDELLSMSFSGWVVSTRLAP